MYKHLLYAFAAAACFTALQPSVCRADSLLIGQLSYDIINPAANGVAGTNAFDLYNFTGAPSGSQDAIADSELFSGTLSLVTSSGNISQSFSGVDDSLTNATLYSLSSAVDVYSASLTLTLSNSTGVNIYNNSIPPNNAAVVDLQAVADTSLTPDISPTALVPCDANGDPCDFAAIYVDTASATALTPEPETIWLVLSGMGGVVAYRRRFRFKTR